MTEQLPMFSVGPTLEEARNGLQEALSRGDGALCPCCDQHAKVYRRKLNASMARALLWLVRHYESTRSWCDVPRQAPAWLLRSRELPKLAYWGLIQQQVNDDDPTKRCSGIWRPTQIGCLFAHGRRTVASHVEIYNGAVIGHSDKQITIKDALGKRFNYAELMGSSSST
jgi:hypothetical protein